MPGSEAGQGWYDPNMYGGAPGAIGTGMDGATNTNGYNGQVTNFKDFISAVLGGLGAVIGGPLAGPLAIGSLAASGGKTMSPVQALKGLFSTPGAAAAGVGDGLSAGNISLGGPAAAQGVAGPMAGTLETGLNGMGNITGGGDRMGPAFEGPDLGAQGDRTAEARGFAGGGGALNAAIRGRKKR